MHETRGGGFVVGRNHFGVVGTVTMDMRDGIVQRIDHAHGEDQIEVGSGYTIVRH